MGLVNVYRAQSLIKDAVFSDQNLDHSISLPSAAFLPVFHSPLSGFTPSLFEQRLDLLFVSLFYSDFKNAIGLFFPVKDIPISAVKMQYRLVFATLALGAFAAPGPQITPAPKALKARDSLPASSGSSKLSAPKTIAAGASFDGMATPKNP